MAEVLLINPKRRKARKSATSKKRAAPRRARRVRRSNPAPVVSTLRRVTKRRRANPLSARRVTRRRRNPIGSGSAKITAKGIISMFKDAAVGGAGAIGMDVLWGKVNPMLPASIRTSQTGIGAGDAVKAIATAALGKLLSKPTKGLSQKMALGALTTQARDLLSVALPASVTGTLAYANPARVYPGTQRVGPIANRGGVAAYQRPGQTALLNAYQRPGPSGVILSTARAREGFAR